MAAVIHDPHLAAKQQGSSGMAGSVLYTASFENLEQAVSAVPCGLAENAVPAGEAWQRPFMPPARAIDPFSFRLHLRAGNLCRY